MKNRSGKTLLHIAAEKEGVSVIRFLIEKGADVNAKLYESGVAPLHIAARENTNHEVIKFIIEKGADVNAKGDSGKTPLHYAAHNTNPEVHKLLIEKGADVNAKSDSGETPLQLAAVFNNNPEVIKLLINEGTDVNAKDTNGKTPLHHAATFNRNPEIAKLLMAKGADWKLLGWSPLYVAVVNENLQDIQKLLNTGEKVSVQDEMRRTPLHYAARWNTNPAVSKFLIDAGADVNAKDKDGETPLHYAESNTNPEIVKLLIEKGADINAKGKYGGMAGKTPLLRAAEKNTNPEVIKLLIEKGADVNAKITEGVWTGKTPLHSAAEWNTNPEVIKLLIEKGADVNAKDTNGEMPLHYAAKKKINPEVIELLIEKGADVNAKSDSGTTPLHDAARNTNPEVIKLLIEKGADVNAKSDSGETPLHDAARYSNNGVIKLLIEKGADLFAERKNGETPLHHAATFNINPEVIKLLIAKGADWKLLGWSPLHVAVMNENLQDIQNLLNTGEKVSVQDKQERTPLHYAARWHTNTTVIEFLMDAGADVNTKDKDGKTPLDLARARNAEVRTYLSVAKLQAERKALLTGAIDLNAEVKNSGFRYVSEYVQYGSSNLRDRLRRADEFDRPGINAQIEAKQREIARTKFFGEYPYFAANVKMEGDVSSVTLVLDTGFSATQIEGSFTSPFPDIKCSNETISNQILEYAFLTKDDKLRLIQPSERQAMADGGFLYARFHNYSNLVFTIRGKTDSIKELVREKDGYRVIVVFSGLSYSNKSVPVIYHLINSDGTLRAGNFITVSGNVVSNPFVTDKSEEIEKVSAEVMNIAIIKKE